MVSAAPNTASRPRVALWDHARFVLIVGVVMSHLLTTVRMENGLAYALYVFMFLFHMPAMILLSGLFSRPEVSPKAIRSTLQLIAVWLLWEGIWVPIRLLLDGTWPGANWLVSPAWTLWFLVSLATMRILFPYVARLKHPLVFSIILALVAGFAPAIGVSFSASRTLCLLPFFITGWLIRDRGWLDGDWFMRGSRRLQTAGTAVLIFAAAGLATIPNLSDTWRIDKWLTWRSSYATLFDEAAPPGFDPGWGQLAGPVIRLVLLGVAGLLTFAVLAAVPRGETRFTVWGARTLYVYLLHGPIIMVLRRTGAIEWIDGLGPLGIPLILLLGAAIAMLLSTRIVSRVFRPVIEPNIAPVLKRDVGQR